MSKIRIMLVDDHILVRMGLVTATRNQPDMEVVGEVEDGEEALATFRRAQPDVVILDLRMPKTDGVDIISEIRRESRSARILVLSNYASGDDISRAMQAGADGYVQKGMPLDQLLTAIRTVHGGGHFVPPEFAARLTWRVQSQLSGREVDVLRLIAGGRSNKEIAVQLDVSESTVKTHVTNILAKLRAADRTEAVTVAVKQKILQLE